MSRRAAFEMPINYIYVILVGGFALFLFATIAFQTGEAGILNNAREIARYFDNRIETLSEDTNRIGNTEDLMIDRFFIITDNDGRSKIRYKNIEQMLKSNVFSKQDLFGQVSFWTYPFKTGYTSSNLVFMGDQRTTYFLVYDSSDSKGEKLADELLSELPLDYQDYFKINVGGAGILTSFNAQTDIIICLGNVPSSFSCDRDIIPDLEDYPMYGKIFFENSEESEYYNYGMLFAGVFAHNYTYYERGIQIPRKRHEITGDILIEKIDAFLLMGHGATCNSGYNSIKNTLENIKERTGINIPNTFHTNLLQMFRDNDELKANSDCIPVF